MSLEDIFEARDFTVQLEGLQSNDREYRIMMCSQLVGSVTL